MSNEKKFRRAVKNFVIRRNGIDLTFYAKVNEDGTKELIAKVPMHDEWTKLFHFDGKDMVSIKNRLSDNWTDKITLDAFELAYGGECIA